MRSIEIIDKIQSEIPSNVKIVAVSKRQPQKSLDQLYLDGYRVFGESRVQELTEKYNSMEKDIEWHMIGRLQTNKVKYIIPFIALIHSVDSLKLMEVIDKLAVKHNRVVDILIQLNISNEEAKGGFLMDQINNFEKNRFIEYNGIRVIGIMGMAIKSENENEVRDQFTILAENFKEIKKRFFSEVDYFTEISMGMSGDYRLAVEQGSTMVRIGSTIFGKRDY